MSPNLNTSEPCHVFLSPIQQSPIFLNTPLAVVSALVSHSLSELHHFAAMVGLSEVWFKAVPGQLPYYSLTRTMRRRCLNLGAIPIKGPDVDALRLYWKLHPLSPMEASPPRTSSVLFPFS